MVKKYDQNALYVPYDPGGVIWLHGSCYLHTHMDRKVLLSE